MYKSVNLHSKTPSKAPKKRRKINFKRGIAIFGRVWYNIKRYL